MPALTYTSSDFPFVPFTKIFSADVNQCFTDISTLLNTTKLNSANVQVHGLTRTGSSSNLAAGTANALVVNDSSGDMSNLALGSAGNLVRVNTAGTAFEVSYTAPTQQTLTNNSATAGYVFTVSTTSTVSVGDVYKDNNGAGVAYTVIQAVGPATGEVFWGTGAVGSLTTPLVKQSGNAGSTSSIAFTSARSFATYTTPAGVKYLKVRMVGGGAGGSGSGGGSSPGNGAAGTSSKFGANVLIASGGQAGTGNAIFSGNGAAGGSATSGLSGVIILGTGGPPGISAIASSNAYANGGQGSFTSFGGAGRGGNQGAGGAAAANSGSGGGGAGCLNTGASASTAGAGGCSATYLEGYILAPSATYPWLVGIGGAGGSAGNSTNTSFNSAGGAGGDGYIEVMEYYV